MDFHATINSHDVISARLIITRMLETNLLDRVADHKKLRLVSSDGTS